MATVEAWLETAHAGYGRYAPAFTSYGVENADDLSNLLEADDVACLLDVLARPPYVAPVLHRNIIFRTLQRMKLRGKGKGRGKGQQEGHSMHARNTRAAAVAVSVNAYDDCEGCALLTLGLDTDVSVGGQDFSVHGQVRLQLQVADGGHLCVSVMPCSGDGHTQRATQSGAQSHMAGHAADMPTATSGADTTYACAHAYAGMSTAYPSTIGMFSQPGRRPVAMQEAQFTEPVASLVALGSCTIATATTNATTDTAVAGHMSNTTNATTATRLSGPLGLLLRNSTSAQPSSPTTHSSLQQQQQQQQILPEDEPPSPDTPEPTSPAQEAFNSSSTSPYKALLGLSPPSIPPSSPSRPTTAAAQLDGGESPRRSWKERFHNLFYGKVTPPWWEQPLQPRRIPARVRFSEQLVTFAPPPKYKHGEEGKGELSPISPEQDVVGLELSFLFDANSQRSADAAGNSAEGDLLRRCAADTVVGADGASSTNSSPEPGTAVPTVNHPYSSGQGMAPLLSSPPKMSPLVDSQSLTSDDCGDGVRDTFMDSARELTTGAGGSVCTEERGIMPTMDPVDLDTSYESYDGSYDGGDCSQAEISIGQDVARSWAFASMFKDNVKKRSTQQADESHEPGHTKLATTGKHAHSSTSDGTHGTNNANRHNTGTVTAAVLTKTNAIVISGHSLGAAQLAHGTDVDNRGDSLGASSRANSGPPTEKTGFGFECPICEDQNAGIWDFSQQLPGPCRPCAAIERARFAEAEDKAKLKLLTSAIATVHGTHARTHPRLDAGAERAVQLTPPDAQALSLSAYSQRAHGHAHTRPNPASPARSPRPADSITADSQQQLGHAAVPQMMPPGENSGASNSDINAKDAIPASPLFEFTPNLEQDYKTALTSSPKKTGESSAHIWWKNALKMKDTGLVDNELDGLEVSHSLIGADGKPVPRKLF